MPQQTQDQRDTLIRAILASPLQGASALPPNAACALDRMMQAVRIHTEEAPKGKELSLIFQNRFRVWFREYPVKGYQYEGFEGGDFSTW